MGAYYNDNDPATAAWLRNLVAAGELPAGDVDDRSIEDVTPDDLHGYTQLHWFAGIGGWPLALRLARWPDDRPAWTASCPCQPLSSAGLRQGAADERHLWPALFALVAELRPAVVFGEQVESPLGREWFAGVRLDLESLGFACGAADLSAAGVGAPHIRQRIYFAAFHGGRLFRPGAERAVGREGLADPGRGSDEPDRLDVGAAAGGVGGEARQQRVRVDVGDGGTDRGLAESDEFDGRSGTRRQDRPEVGDHRGDRGLADSEGRAPRPGHDLRTGQPDTGEGRGLVHSDSERNADSSRREGRRRDQRPQEPPGVPSIADWWDDGEWIACRDGKARRAQPGAFPLAARVPDRLVKLRGYGNAVVPPLAAEFVLAALEAFTEATEVMV